MGDRSYRASCRDAVPDRPDGVVFHVPQPLRRRTWTDDFGREWRRRGQDLLEPRHARKLLSRDDVTVMHVYDGEVHEHQGAEREGLLRDIEHYWAGEADPTAAFELGEFRSHDHATMVMVVESC